MDGKTEQKNDDYKKGEGVERGVNDVVAKKLLESIRQLCAIKDKSNAEIADLLIEHLWGDYEIDSIQSALLELTIDRLRH